MALLLKAYEKERDERLFAQWTAQLPIMAMDGKPIGFEEYKNQVTGADIDRRPTEVILAELDEVEKQFQHLQKGGVDGGD